MADSAAALLLLLLSVSACRCYGDETGPKVFRDGSLVWVKVVKGSCTKTCHGANLATITGGSSATALCGFARSASNIIDRKFYVGEACTECAGWRAIAAALGWAAWACWH